MGKLRHIGRYVVMLVRSRLPWLPAPKNTESPLPYVLHRPTVNPVLPVHDMDAAIEFYRSVGFAVSAYDAGYAWVRTCGWEFLHLALAPTLEPAGSSAGAYIHVTDVNDWHRAMVENAPTATIGPITDTPWGMREFSISDPSGNVIRVGQNL